MGCRRSPFLNMGTTLAVVESIGIVPCFNEAWKNSVNVGVRYERSYNDGWSLTTGYMLTCFQFTRRVQGKPYSKL